MTLSEYKAAYNKILPVMGKAIVFMDGPASAEEKDRGISKFRAVNYILSRLIAKIEQAGYKMMPEEIENGFNI